MHHPCETKKRLIIVLFPYKCGNIWTHSPINTHACIFIKYLMLKWHYGYRLMKWTQRTRFIFWMKLSELYLSLIPLKKAWNFPISHQLLVNSKADCSRSNHNLVHLTISQIEIKTKVKKWTLTNKYLGAIEREREREREWEREREKRKNEIEKEWMKLKQNMW